MVDLRLGRRRPVRRRIRYGTAASCIVEAWYRATSPVGVPVAVLVHGGYWRDRYDRHLMDPLAADLARRGWLAWNIEYRRVGADGGGWPTTFEDVRRAVAALDRAPVAVDRDRVVVIGHSAGGHLALWLAANDAGIAGVVAQAPVTDLRRSWRDHASDDAVVGLLGGPPGSVPERYEAASPLRLVPIGVPHLVLHGTADTAVPHAMSVDYVAAARAAGDDVEFVSLPGADHFAVIDPRSAAWRAQLTWLSARFGPLP